MDKIYKEKWLKALRSGDYKQCEGSLRKVSPSGKHSYCCLGVLADILSKEGKGEWGETSNEPFTDYTGQKAAGGLTNYMLNEVGLPINESYVELPKSMDKRTHLVGLNDGSQYTFEQIADVIEEQL